MTEVSELDGTEGGVWLVWTQTSSYIMDLETMTVTRYPGPRSRPNINDATRPIRTIDRCQVGESGFWTMFGSVFRTSDDVACQVDFLWQRTTAIASIEQIDDDDS